MPRFTALRGCGRGAPGPVGVHGPAVDALKSSAAAAFRPLLGSFNQVRSLKDVVDANDYHVGMPFGLLIAGIASYQLFKEDPSTFVDAALGYAFYKLSILSSQVYGRGFANDFLTRIK